MEDEKSILFNMGGVDFQVPAVSFPGGTVSLYPNQTGSSEDHHQLKLWDGRC